MTMKIDNERERLLCYAAGLLQAKLGHPGNAYSAEGLIPGCIREAQLLIDAVYEVKKDENST